MTLTKQEINLRYYEKKRASKIAEFFILNENENYKSIEDGSYYLTNQGRVFSTITCKFLKGFVGKNGYMSYTLCKRKRYTLHRLLGKYFLENPDNLPVIDHIDRNRLNNDLSNLRWVSISDNSSNRMKGSIHERKDIVKGKTYSYWRVYYYTDGSKKSISFKDKTEAEIFFNNHRR